MSVVVPIELPESSLLLELRRDGGYADCFTTRLPAVVTQAQYVEAFYTTRLFKAERLILRLLASGPSTDQDARDLAQGKKDAFAVWQVARRTPEQLLLSEQTGKTSSWLMAVAEPATTSETTTRLYFGSAITGRKNARTGAREFSPVFHLLLGLHTLYSRLLLQAAARKLLADSRHARA